MTPAPTNVDLPAIKLHLRASAKRVAKAEAKLSEETGQRDAAIIQARGAGMSFREIAELVGLTHTGVAHVLRRFGVD